MPRSYRANNKRLINRSGNGRFRKTTLNDFGIGTNELQEGRAICADCGYGSDDCKPWYPILKTGYCPECRSQKKKELNQDD